LHTEQGNAADSHQRGLLRSGFVRAADPRRWADHAVPSKGGASRSGFRSSFRRRPRWCQCSDTEQLLVGNLARIGYLTGSVSVHVARERRASSLASAAPRRAQLPVRTAERSRRCADRVSPGSGVLLVPRADRRCSAIRASAGPPSDAEYMVAGGPRVVHGGRPNPYSSGFLRVEESNGYG
jgi:hypothetical protein